MNDFIKYINGLHNYNAQNQNAYVEKNCESPYYKETMVQMPVSDFILRSIQENEPHIIILTGHAGDGKTSVMYQVIAHIYKSFAFKKDAEMELQTEDGKTCYCIKDFSELPDTKKLEKLQQIMEFPKMGKFVFMVANTGPLINTFGKLYQNSEKSEAARMKLIESMDSNDGKIRDIFGHKLTVINIAAIDNTRFAKQYLSKILDEKLWRECENCEKQKYCHIYRNRCLLYNNRDRAFDFIEKYYIWQSEYGVRLTIRSMTEQLAYMLTGGMECGDICAGNEFIYLFPDLFFGYVDTVSNTHADNILAVKCAKNSQLYTKRLRVDEELLIRRNYKKLFGNDVYGIIKSVEEHKKYYPGWDEELRRIYLFLNIVDDKQNKQDIEDVFSRQFLPYLRVRSHAEKPGRQQRELVIDALRMIYLGTVINNNKSHVIPITFSTESGVTQSVQLIAGRLSVGDIELKQVQESELNKETCAMILSIRKVRRFRLTLPMMDYFDELRNGIISTDIDPQLSHGIENLKAILLEISSKDDDMFDILVMSNNGFINKSMAIENGMITIQ